MKTLGQPLLWVPGVLMGLLASTTVTAHWSYEERFGIANAAKSAEHTVEQVQKQAPRVLPTPELRSRAAAEKMENNDKKTGRYKQRAKDIMQFAGVSLIFVVISYFNNKK